MKTRIKSWIKKISHLSPTHKIISYAILSYIFIVYLTSKKIFLNDQLIDNINKNREPLIYSFWHNRLMMMAFLGKKITKSNDLKFITLASKHGDGRFVGKIMEKFGFISILGSTVDRRNPERGISYSSLKQIITRLKKGHSLGITPDGPRGPNQKINSEIINIARLSGAKIACCSVAYSKFIQINSWDKFKIALPFGKIVFYIDEKFISINKKLTEEELIKNNHHLEGQMNRAQDFVDRAIS